MPRLQVLEALQHRQEREVGSLCLALCLALRLDASLRQTQRTYNISTQELSNFAATVLADVLALGDRRFPTDVSRCPL